MGFARRSIKGVSRAPVLGLPNTMYLRSGPAVEQPAPEICFSCSQPQKRIFGLQLLLCPPFFRSAGPPEVFGSEKDGK